VFSAPRLLTGPESLLLAGMAAIVGGALAAHFGRWASPHARSAGTIAAALVASTLVIAPVTAWAVVSDTRAAQRLSDREAERFGPESYGFDTSVTDRIAALVPPADDYRLVASDGLEANRALGFRLWSLSSLLPRIAAADPSSADWIISWGVPPRELGVAVHELHVLALRGRSQPPVYVARVDR
jgi:hypothetical protein